MRREVKPRVLILRVQDKPVSTQLSKLAQVCDVLVLKVAKPSVRTRVLKLVQDKLRTCDVAIFTSSIACRVLAEHNVKIEAKYYIAIGEDTERALIRELGVSRELVLRPRVYTSDHVYELLHSLVQRDPAVHVVHVYRSGLGGLRFAHRSYPRQIVIRELGLYDLCPDDSALAVAAKLLPDADLVVLLSAYIVELVVRSCRDVLVNKPVIVPSARVAEHAHRLGLHKVYVLSNVTDEALVRLVEKLVRERAY